MVPQATMANSQTTAASIILLACCCAASHPQLISPTPKPDAPPSPSSTTPSPSPYAAASSASVLGRFSPPSSPASSPSSSSAASPPASPASPAAPPGSLARFFFAASDRFLFLSRWSARNSAGQAAAAAPSVTAAGHSQPVREAEPQALLLQSCVDRPGRCPA